MWTGDLARQIAENGLEIGQTPGGVTSDALQLIPNRNKTTAERRYEKASGTSALQVNQGD